MPTKLEKIQWQLVNSHPHLALLILSPSEATRDFINRQESDADAMSLFLHEIAHSALFSQAWEGRITEVREMVVETLINN